MTPSHVGTSRKKRHSMFCDLVLTETHTQHSSMALFLALSLANLQFKKPNLCPQKLTFVSELTPRVNPSTGQQPEAMRTAQMDEFNVNAHKNPRAHVCLNSSSVQLLHKSHKKCRMTRELDRGKPDASQPCRRVRQMRTRTSRKLLDGLFAGQHRESKKTTRNE